MMESPSTPHPSPAGERTPEDNFYSPENYEFYSKRPYEPLNKSKRSIRLLAVLHRDESGRFHCKLTDEISLTEAHGNYTAVSYCAGDPKKTRVIEVNGMQFNAFANLVVALDETCHYRARAHGDKEPLLWLDQICINQSDTAERSHQVNFMRDIYRSARDVVICLSTDRAKSQALNWLELAGAIVPGLQKVLETASSHEKSLKAVESAMPEKRKAIYKNADGIDENVLGKFNLYLWANINNEVFVNGWHDVLKMLKQPWWTRAWVVQEYLVSQEIQFIYGRQSMQGITLSVVLAHFIAVLPTATERNLFLEVHSAISIPDGPEDRQICRLRENQSSISDSMTAAHSIITHKLLHTRYKDLKTLLSHSRLCGASDPRDHVYAFVGLADPIYSVVPNYSACNTVEAVFTDTARRIITYDDNLSILSHAEAALGSSYSTLPSWVPDWTTKEPTGRRKINEHFVREEKYSASQGAKADATFFESGRVLEISGLLVDILGVQGNEVVTPYDKYFPIFKDCLIFTSGAAMKYDELWILYGANLPFVLRKCRHQYKLVCEATLRGAGRAEEVMNGQYMITRRGEARRMQIC